MNKYGAYKSGRPRGDLFSLYQKQRGRCHYCKRSMNLGGGGPSHATRDHVVPRALGGKDAGNLVAACVTCNQQKGCMSAGDFWRWINDGRPRALCAQTKDQMANTVASVATSGASVVPVATSRCGA